MDDPACRETALSACNCTCHINRNATLPQEAEKGLPSLSSSCWQRPGRSWQQDPFNHGRLSRHHLSRYMMHALLHNIPLVSRCTDVRELLTSKGNCDRQIQALLSQHCRELMKHPAQSSTRAPSAMATADSLATAYLTWLKFDQCNHAVSLLSSMHSGITSRSPIVACQYWVNIGRSQA